MLFQQAELEGIPVGTRLDFELFFIPKKAVDRSSLCACYEMLSLRCIQQFSRQRRWRIMTLLLFAYRVCLGI